MPQPSIQTREQRGRVFFEALWRHQGKVVKRRVGEAWLEPGSHAPRKGRVPEGYLDERGATVAAAELVEAYAAEHAAPAGGGTTFREVAHAYLAWVSDVKGARPSTLYDYRSMLAEPGDANGVVMAAIGDRPAAEVSTREINDMLASIGGSARTRNKYRTVVSAIFTWGMRASTFGLPTNPAKEADRRRQPQRGALAYYSPADIESVARACVDPQDAEAVRIAAFTGLRLGEMLALRWKDVDFDRRVITVQRAMSAGIEGETKSSKARQIPLVTPAADALRRLQDRGEFVDAGELVLVNHLGRHLDGSALRRRYRKAQTAAGVAPLKWHDLRHSFGSLLAAGGISLVEIQSAMGHSDPKTTGIYLHARPATTQAERFSAAFQ